MDLSNVKACVALRKESVDRNRDVFFCHEIQAVALRKESVDRNTLDQVKPAGQDESLSARRAWIEILVL